VQVVIRLSERVCQRGICDFADEILAAQGRKQTGIGGLFLGEIVDGQPRGHRRSHRVTICVQWLEKTGL
jgi:hypothetical protein